MINKVMLTMESRIHGDMYVRFGGRLVETYHRKVEKRCWPSLLKELADICKIKKVLTFHVARHTFSTTICLDNGLPIETLSKMLGHSDIKITQAYAKVSNRKIEEDVNKLNSILQ